MAEKNKKYSLQRRVYRTTRSAMRRWRAHPLPPSAPRRLRIFTNVQSASVAGISRVMSSFLKYAQQSPNQTVEMVCVSVVPPGDQDRNNMWHKAEDKQQHVTSWLYEYESPSFTGVLNSARSLQDVRRAFEPLVEVFYQKLREEKPDVVLINGTYLVPWCLMMAARRLRLPIVHHYHGSLTKETEHWDNIKHRTLIQSIEASFDHLHTKYVFPSMHTRHYVERHIFKHSIYHARVLVLPNPIPEEFFAVQSPAQKKGVAFVGRWTRVKNTSFLDRFAYINYRSADPLDIYVVTDDRGKTKANKVLHNRVQFAGPFDNAKDMARFYAGMQVVICPSHFETYGNVAQEAVASGTPALVSRTMGVAEVFKKAGLDHLIINFQNVRHVHSMIQNGQVPPIQQSKRRSLYKYASAEVIYEQLLEFIKK